MELTAQQFPAAFRYPIFFVKLILDNFICHVVIQRLGITENAIGEEFNDCPSRLLFQKIAESLTGICLAHPCSTVVFLTAFDELKSSHHQQESIEERNRQLEADLAVCKNRIQLLADEADERCKLVEDMKMEEIEQCKKNYSLTIANIRNQMDVERMQWLQERDSFVNEITTMSGKIEQMRKQLEDEVSDARYFKELCSTLREDLSNCEKERNAIRAKRQLKKTEISGAIDRESYSDSDSLSSESHSSAICQMSVDLQKQLDSQIALNKSLSLDVARLEEQLHSSLLSLASRSDFILSTVKPYSPKVSRVRKYL